MPRRREDQSRRSRKTRIVHPIQNHGKTDIFVNPLNFPLTARKRLKAIEFSSKHVSKRGETPGGITNTGMLQRHKSIIMLYIENDAPYWTDRWGNPPIQDWPSTAWWNVDVGHFETELARFQTDDLSIGIFITYTGAGAAPFSPGYHMEYNIPTGSSLPAEGIGGMRFPAWKADYPASDFFFNFHDPLTDQELQYFLDDFDIILAQTVTDPVYTKVYLAYTHPLADGYFNNVAKHLRENMDFECVRYQIAGSMLGNNGHQWMDHLARILRGEFNSQGYEEL